MFISNDIERELLVSAKYFFMYVCQGTKEEMHLSLSVSLSFFNYVSVFFFSLQLL